MQGISKKNMKIITFQLEQIPHDGIAPSAKTFPKWQNNNLLWCCLKVKPIKLVSTVLLYETQTRWNNELIKHL